MRNIPTPSIPTLNTLKNAVVELQRAILDLFKGYGTQKVTGLDIDWSRGDTFYKEAKVASAMTFSNMDEGRSITLIVRSLNGVVPINITFPTIFKVTAWVNAVGPSKYNVYSFVYADGKIFASQLTDLA